MLSLTVTSNVSEAHSERRFAPTITLGELKCRCELLTGASAGHMRLELRNKEDELLASLEQADDAASLEQCNVADGMTLHVVDVTRGSGEAQNGDGEENDVPKYEMSNDDYDKRTDSVRAFLQRNKMGKFGEKAGAEAAADGAGGGEQCDIAVGSRCEVRVGGPSAMAKRGTVRYAGAVHFKRGIWVGVQYDEPLGRNDGSIQGKRYFECAANYGAFVRPQDVTVGDFAELSLEDDDDALDEI